MRLAFDGCERRLPSQQVAPVRRASEFLDRSSSLCPLWVSVEGDRYHRIRQSISTRYDHAIRPLRLYHNRTPTSILTLSPVARTQTVTRSKESTTTAS